MKSAPAAGSAESDNTADYRQTVLVRVHQLLKCGYDRLERSRYRNAPEEEISGDFADAIERVMDDASAPGWMDSFSVHNERPVRDPIRKGKRRRRIDLRIDSARRRPRTRFAFEAKRLGADQDLRTYVGPNGLGRFLQGAYAQDDAMAGMLGYVQSGTLSQWATKLGREFGRSKRQYGVIEGGAWARVSMVDGMDHTYCTQHDRKSIGNPIAIYHSLLDFV